MGLRGIENSVTRLEDVFVPEENRIGTRGRGPEDRAHARSTPVAWRCRPSASARPSGRPRSGASGRNERVQWGRTIGKHDAVAQKLAFIAASAFGLEAMLDVASRLADDKSSDIRIEAALGKLYASELGWKVLDELMQIRGGRGYETAASLKARGEKPVPVEQALRDMRINRIFEGSSEIMHLLIAREAVDQHLQVAGDMLEAGRRAQGQGQAPPVEAAKFYSRVAAPARRRQGAEPALLRRVRRARASTCATSSGPRASWRARPSTAMSRWQAKLEYRQAFLGRIVDIGAELFAMAAAVAYADTIGREQPERRESRRSSWPSCSARQAQRRADTLFDELWAQRRRRNGKAAADKLLEGRYAWLEEGITDPSGEGPMIPDEVKESAGGRPGLTPAGTPRRRAGSARPRSPAGRRSSHSVSSAAGTGRLR